MVILIIAMMVFGPRRLPEMAAKAGKIVRDLRNMSQGLLLEWQREITVAARLDDLEETRRELVELKKELSQTQREIGQQAQKEVQQFQKQVAGEAAKVEDTLKTGVEQVADEAAKVEDALKTGVEQLSETLPTDGKASPDTGQPSKDDTPEMTSEETPPQASNSDSKQPQEQESSSDTSPAAETPKPVVKPKVSRAVKANGRASKPAPPSEQPSQPKEALNE